MLKSQLIYCDLYGQSKGFLLQSSDKLNKLLAENQSISMEGNQDDNFIITDQKSTYTMQLKKGHNTMLVTDMKEGLIYHGTLTIIKELQDIITIQQTQPQYHFIYPNLMKNAIDQIQYKQQLWENLKNEHAFTFEELLKIYKISKSQLIKLLEAVHCIYLRHQQKYLLLSNSLISLLMRNLIIFLTENKLITEYFSFQTVKQGAEVACPQILDILAQKLKFSRKQGQYKIQNTSIIRFILIDLSLVKNVYLANEFDSLLQQSMKIYMPILQQIPKVVEQIGFYYILLPKQNQIIYYDALTIQWSVQERIKFMQKYKKRFSLNEVQGLLYGAVSEDMIFQICNKNFRKYGNQFQIKNLSCK